MTALSGPRLTPLRPDYETKQVMSPLVQNGVVIWLRQMWRVGNVRQLDHVFVEPFAVRMFPRVSIFDFFVGDSIFDITAGNAAGVKTIAVLWGAAKKDEFDSARPSAYVSTSSELTSLVASLG